MHRCKCVLFGRLLIELNHHQNDVLVNLFGRLNFLEVCSALSSAAATLLVVAGSVSKAENGLYD